MGFFNSKIHVTKETLKQNPGLTNKSFEIHSNDKVAYGKKNEDGTKELIIVDKD